MTRRLYISADIEGVGGVVSKEQLMPSGFEYQQAREWMTGEVRAACEAAFAGGVEEIVVSDSHGNGQNLLLDKLPGNVQVVRSWPRPLCMMEGLQHGSYEGALLIGYHVGATGEGGVLSHTMHGNGIAEIRLNGEAASETVISAATAAHYGVPVIMASGDDAYAKHVNEVLSGTETAITKWACSHISARMRLPAEAQREIAEATTRALSRLDEFKVEPLDTPINVEIRCVRRLAAQLLAYLPCVEQIDPVTIRFEGEDMIAVSRFIAFLLSSGALTPA